MTQHAREQVEELLNKMPQIMRPALWPNTCGADACAHRLCVLVRQQAVLPCAVCGERVEAGQSYYIVSIESGEVRVQVHAWCKGIGQ